jgi:hypothetical protein
MSLPILRLDGNGNPPANGKIRRDLAPPGLQYGNKIVKNHIGHMLMKDTLITIRPQI